MYEAKLYKIDFDVKGDDRGALIAIENSKDIPFDIKRLYYIYGTQEHVVRGKHAHKKLKQVLICVSGSVDIKCQIKDQIENITLNSPNVGLYIEGLVWHEMLHFSNDAVLIVVADNVYDESDYIRNYDMFSKLSSEN